MEIKPERDGKTNAIIAYFTIFGTLIAYILNMDKQNQFASFHIRQALGLNLLFVIFGYVVGYFDSWLITFPFYISISILWIYGFITMLQEKYTEVPLVGSYFQKWFTFIK
ncbi:hypothetical protein HX109_13340 [Galbibacter sp. BG1]|uniref:hypothetical protein n=1 Tax=Galbibacter sp. BG1 TaxID=1170699 RepID=UPI0015BF1BDA|nr:hypothetical protein [Galbibacter sp. BG1]QLE02491.1 hypothetical protein HX109_13340 [Galbibacter sp. BG1]